MERLTSSVQRAQDISFADTEVESRKARQVEEADLEVVVVGVTRRDVNLDVRWIFCYVIGLIYHQLDTKIRLLEKVSVPCLDKPLVDSLRS